MPLSPYKLIQRGGQVVQEVETLFFQRARLQFLVAMSNGSIACNSSCRGYNAFGPWGTRTYVYIHTHNQKFLKISLKTIQLGRSITWPRKYPSERLVHLKPSYWDGRNNKPVHVIMYFSFQNSCPKTGPISHSEVLLGVTFYCHFSATGQSFFVLSLVLQAFSHFL